jgi:hypothetical protein
MRAVLLLLALLASDPPRLVATDAVDLLELNHYYDEHGKHVYDQVVFYDFRLGESRRYIVRAWRLVKTPGIQPRRDWSAAGWRSTWFDGELLRDVTALSFRETWTQADPELLNRALLAKEHRRELSDTPLRPLLRPVRPPYPGEQEVKTAH